MNDKCNLIRDILPLYVEDMVSTDTREFVSEHLEHC
ncbi:MAG: zf-HC2 domain-containing protein, partial [Ruminococcus sp.]|nr:zf-HC2 domain-containing protein [Ruminococcus sp.]